MISALLLALLGAARGRAGGRRRDRRGRVAAAHVVLILTDDQRADTIGAWGNPHIGTPHLDALAARGTSFHRAYCMGSRGAQSASRAGDDHGRPYFGMNLQSFDGAETLGAALGAAGYTTFHNGVWHNGRGSFARSFQRGDRVMFSGMSNHRAVPSTDFAGGEFSETVNLDGHSSELFAEAAVSFLESTRADRSSCPSPSAHDPRDPPRPWARPYAGSRRCCAASWGSTPSTTGSSCCRTRSSRPGRGRATSCGTSSPSTTD